MTKKLIPRKSYHATDINPFYLKIMDDADFIEGRFDTGYVKKFLPDETDVDEDE